MTTADLVTEVEERLCIALEHDWRTWYGHRFVDRYDRVGVPCRWTALDLLRLALHPVVGAEKDRLPLWGPTTYGLQYMEAGREVCRRASNAELLSMVVLDVDDGTSVDELIEPGVFCMAHTSWSHREDAPRCRLVLPLNYPIPANGWSELYGAIVADADRQCRDPSRAYFLLAVGAGGPHRAVYRPGDRLDLRTDHEAALARPPEAAAARRPRALPLHTTYAAPPAAT